jgi:hypothetical protein
LCTWLYIYIKEAAKVNLVDFGGLHNVRGEPVFSVMAAGWFCEVWLNWESGGCETGALKINKKRISTGNHLMRRTFTLMNCATCGFHPV